VRAVVDRGPRSPKWGSVRSLLDLLSEVEICHSACLLSAYIYYKQEHFRLALFRFFQLVPFKINDEEHKARMFLIQAAQKQFVSQDPEQLSHWCPSTPSYEMHREVLS
jgi:hypothetical protein